MNGHSAPEGPHCRRCGALMPTPGEGGYKALWWDGWRWIGTAGLYSCPGCPPVVVEVGGKHRRGPGFR